MINPRLEMQRLAGKVALLLTFVYMSAWYAAVVGVVIGSAPPPLAWMLLPLPAFAFVPSVVDAIRLHRTEDKARLRTLWRRCILLAVVGTVVLVAVVALLGRIEGAQAGSGQTPLKRLREPIHVPLAEHAPAGLHDAPDRGALP